MLPPTKIDIWDKLTLAQHHGLATRLLDWTKNPLIALFFATNDFNNNSDGALYIYDYTRSKIIDTTYIDPFSQNIKGIIYPTGLTSRIINQRGLFSISHLPNLPFDEQVQGFITKYKIPFNSKNLFQKALEKYGINEFSIYNDLDNLSNYLNRFILRSSYKDLNIITT